MGNLPGGKVCVWNFLGLNFQCGENSGGEKGFGRNIHGGEFSGGESTGVEPSGGNFLGGKLPVTGYIGSITTVP